MNWQESNDQEKKSNILKVLVRMINSTSSQDPAELVYLHQLGKSFGYTPQEVNEMLSTDSSTIVIPTSERDRMTILFYLILLIKVDKRVSKEEERLIHHFGFKLGFRDTLMRDFTDTVRAYANRKLPPNVLLDTIKKYLN